ncbi:MAG: carboxypeptidase regulatory-like domain-containing protein [Vicinamibacterales bacterium]
MRLFVALVVSLVALGSPAVAQITSATISGTIKDETGGVLPGVDVVISNLDTGVTRSVVTDENGYYTVPGLAPGRYEARATLQGFSTAVQSGMVLEVAQQAGLNLVLKLGAAEETITVTGESPLVDVRSSALSAVVDQKTIEELPLNGRNYIALATLQPGIVHFTEKVSTSPAQRGVQLNINGMGGRSNSYLIDGANMRGYAGHATVTAGDSTLGVETIQEFRVVTNSFSADYGRVMGGVVSIATRSGTNVLHGSAFEFFRNSKMDARNFFDVGDPAPFTRHQFGGAGGGPIVRNRIFFYGGFERLQEDLGTTVITAVPTAAARMGAVNPAVRPYLDLYPLPNGPDLGPGIGQYSYEFNRATRENFAQGRVDIELSEKDLLFVRHTYDGSSQLSPVSSGAIQTTGVPQFYTTSVSGNHFFTAEAKRTVTQNLLNTARFSSSILTYEQNAANTLSQPLSFVSDAPFMGLILIGGLSQIGNYAAEPSTQNIDYLTWSDDITYTRGKHLLKTGVLIERAFADKLTTVNSRGTYTFANMAQFFAGTPTRFQGNAPGAEFRRQRPNTLFGFYLQDDYRMTSNLTLNLGVRYEFFTVPKDRNGRDAYIPDILTSTDTVLGGPFRNPSLKNVAPRVGFAWDVTGDGRTAVRGGSGLYYDTDSPFNSSLGVSIQTPPFVNVVNITGAGIPFPTPVISASGAAGGRTVRTLDYNIKQPKGWTYNLNLQRELVANWAMTVGYAGSRAYDLVSLIEANPVVPVIRADGSMFFPAGAPRRNPAWGSIDYRTSDGRSTYHALQAGLMKRFSDGYQVQLSYTLSRAMDNADGQVSTDTVSSAVFAQNPYDPDAEWAVAAFDAPHVFSANATWELPVFRGNPVLSGWQLNGIVSLHTGYPFSPSIQTINWSRSGNISANAEDRPNVKPGTDPKKIITGDPNRWFDVSAFELPLQGTFGNTPRNYLRGPGFANVDMSLVKNQAVGANNRVQIRLEVFNLLNRANFSTPTRPVFAGANQNEAPLATAGKVTRTVNSSRQLQLGIKFMF